MIRVSKTFKFDAAHYLPEHKGECNNMHGHSYKLEVVLKGYMKNDGPEKGMVIDFKRFKDIVQHQIINVVDHRCLNDIFTNPTAEFMINEFASVLIEYFDENDINIYVDCLRLWETENCYAEWRTSIS